MRTVFRGFKAIIAICVFAAGVISSPAHAQTSKFTQPLAKDAYLAVWTYEPQGEMTIAVSIVNADGKVAVCGAWTISKRMSPYLDEAGTVRKSRENAKILVDGTVVMNSMRSFRRILLKDFEFGADTKCKVTRHPWKSTYSNESVSLDAPWLRPKD